MWKNDKNQLVQDSIAISNSRGSLEFDITMHKHRQLRAGRADRSVYLPTAFLAVETKVSGEILVRAEDENTEGWSSLEELYFNG